MNPFVRRTILALALVGLGSAGTSTFVHYQLVQDPSYTSFCDINDTVSCTQVYLSNYGSVGGIPTALLGAFWFGLVLLLTLAAGPASSEIAENIGGYLLVLSTIGLSVVLFLGYVSFMVIGALCVLCVVVYAAVVGIFLLSGASDSIPWLSIPGRVAGDLKRLVRSPVALVSTLVYLGATAAAVAVFPGEGTGLSVSNVSSTVADTVSDASDDGTEFARYWDAQPRVELPVPHEGAQVLVVSLLLRRTVYSVAIPKNWWPKVLT